MHARTFAILALAAATATITDTSHAQGVEVRIGSPGFYGGFYSGSDYNRYRPRGYYGDYDYRIGDYWTGGYAQRRGAPVYGYVQRYDEPALRTSPGGRGTYHYSDGSTCADARDR